MTMIGGIGWSAPAGDDRSIVGRVRVRAAALTDPAAARARLERVLSDDALRVPGLPASAVLCVRSLRDPLPGGLRLDAFGGSSNAWKRALESELEKRARSAARPIDEPVPADAVAVLFRDRAEMLACLAQDWVRGDTGSWWWKHLIPARAHGRIAPAQWIADAPYVPAAARLLAAKSELVAFAIALDEGEARALVAHVAMAHAVNLARGEPLGIAPDFSEIPALRRWVPEALRAELSEPARAVVGLTLLLARAPSAAQERDVVRAIRASLDAPPKTDAAIAADSRRGALSPTAQPPSRSDPAPSSSLRTVEASGSAPTSPPMATGPDAEGRAETTEPPLQASIALDAAPRPRPESPPPRSVSASAVEASAPDEGGVKRVVRARLIEEESGARPVVPPPAPIAADPSPPPSQRRGASNEANETPRAPSLARAPAPEPSPASSLGRVVATRYGGAFFLLNALLALDLYGDFTRPLSRRVSASPWRLIAGVTRALLGDAAAEDEPLWALLAELAGPSEGEEWPAEWRVDPEWLPPFVDASEGWRWSRTSERLRLAHPAGFAVLDAPLEADEAAQREREIALYAAFGAQGASDSSDATAPHSWPEHLAFFLRARLHAALRAEDAETSVRLALQVRARVRATESHVDVHIALADLPIEVRFAGLDRDPGWVPAAGRFLAFHFE